MTALICIAAPLSIPVEPVPITLATIERQKIYIDSALWHSVLDATGQEFYFKNGPGTVP